MLFTFAFTLFVSATLLFLVQPMIGKMVLPRLGGTPGVWNTCMVFFQGMLLAGYAYTHAVSTWPRRRQLILQFAILALPFLVLPFSLGSWQPPAEYNPALSVLWILLGVVGLPFFVVATSAPLLQKWFAGTDHPAAKDPYFLYGASNLGSMLALLAYPVLVEPWFPLESQAWLWTAAYVLLALLVVCCGLLVWRTPQTRIALDAIVGAPDTQPAVAAASTTKPAPTAITAAKRSRRQPRALVSAEHATTNLAYDGSAITAWRRLRWVGLAAAPTSLMLGVTTYLTTDIAAIPFFWVIPLALYLLTFILVFARWPVVWVGLPHEIMLYVQPCFLMFLVLAMVGTMPIPTLLLFAIHVVAFFTTTLVCHGELAKDRPGPRHLTEFYLWMSVGGVLGGMFNALVAPLIFWTGVIEYPLAMVVASCLRPSLVGDKPVIRGDSTDGHVTRIGIAITTAVAPLIGLFAYWCMSYSAEKSLKDAVPGIESNYQLKPFLLAIPIVLVLGFASRPLRFGLSLGCLLLGVSIYNRLQEKWFYEGRSFFGLVKVEEVEDHWGRYRRLIHGGIDHGRQNIDFPRRPVAYFHPTTGVGQLFTKFSWPDQRLQVSLAGLGAVPGGVITAFNAMGANSEPPFAVVGLGTGTLAAYSRPFQHVVFYEIDPQIKRLSLPEDGRDPAFSYLQDALDRDVRLQVVLGDGRLSLKKAPSGYFHILALDAFSSDAIPVHLLTADAVDLYLTKMVPGGAIIFNTTNKYVDINPVLADIAEDRGLEWLNYGDWGLDEDGNVVPEKFGADWVVMRRPGPATGGGGPPLLERLGKRWSVNPGLGGPIWTDGYSNLLRVMRWRD